MSVQLHFVITLLKKLHGNLRVSKFLNHIDLNLVDGLLYGIYKG